MRAAFDDSSVVEHHDGVCVADGGEPVRDDEDGASLHQVVHAFLDKGLGSGIDGAGCLIEDHDWRVSDRRAGDGDQLALPL